MSAGKIISTLRQRGWKVFRRPYELNIVGIRGTSTKANAFDDRIAVFHNDWSGRLALNVFPATTDPGTFWLLDPANPQGTAILAQGQYVGAYRIGLHRGSYKALVQHGDVKVIRDYDRNAVLDFANGREQTGRFGINIHHASPAGTTKTVDKHSAGCQVFADIAHYSRFMDMCERHRALYGNEFTYSLIDLRAVQRTVRRRFLIGGAAAAVALAAAYAALKAGGEANGHGVPVQKTTKG